MAPFPIIISVLAVFTQAHGGVARIGVLLRNFLLGFCGFAAFCFVLALGLPALTTPATFGIAIGAAVAVQATILLFGPQTQKEAATEVTTSPCSNS